MSWGCGGVISEKSPKNTENSVGKMSIFFLFGQISKIWSDRLWPVSQGCRTRNRIENCCKTDWLVRVSVNFFCSFLAVLGLSALEWLFYVLYPYFLALAMWKLNYGVQPTIWGPSGVHGRAWRLKNSSFWSPFWVNLAKYGHTKGSIHVFWP